jgi:hypothetical protein
MFERPRQGSGCGKAVAGSISCPLSVSRDDRPEIPSDRLFSPSSSLQRFYAEFGWVNAKDTRFSVLSSGCSKS